MHIICNLDCCKPKWNIYFLCTLLQISKNMNHRQLFKVQDTNVTWKDVFTTNKKNNSNLKSGFFLFNKFLSKTFCKNNKVNLSYKKLFKAIKNI